MSEKADAPKAAKPEGNDKGGKSTLKFRSPPQAPAQLVYADFVPNLFRSPGNIAKFYLLRFEPGMLDQPETVAMSAQVMMPMRGLCQMVAFFQLQIESMAKESTAIARMWEAAKEEAKDQVSDEAEEGSTE
jgi:hypothetical protein